MSVIDLVEGRY